MKTQVPTKDGINMQDIRLIAGEGKLSKKTVRQAIAVIRKQRYKGTEMILDREVETALVQRMIGDVNRMFKDTSDRSQAELVAFRQSIVQLTSLQVALQEKK